MPVAVVIPAAAAAATLGSAVTSALDAGADEVVVAVAPTDRATYGAAVDLAATSSRVRVVDNPTGGTSTGLNAAVAATDAAVVARIDAHTRVPSGYLRRAQEVLARTGAAVVGGVQVPVGSDRRSAAIGAAMASPVGAGLARHRVGGSAGPAETAYLGVFDRVWLERVGGYDAALARNQDYEICHRIRQAGGLVWFDPALRVTYQPRGSFAALWRQYHDFGRWKHVVMRRAPSSVRPRQLAPPALVLGLAASVLTAAVGRRRAALLVPAAYAGVLAAGVVTADVATASGGREPPARSEIAAALLVMHLAWGTGVLRGRGASGFRADALQA